MTCPFLAKPLGALWRSTAPARRQLLSARPAWLVELAEPCLPLAAEAAGLSAPELLALSVGLKVTRRLLATSTPPAPDTPEPAWRAAGAVAA